MNLASQDAERVAVIVVHGVADQAPGESVRHVAGLLANVDDGGAPAYAPFTEHPMRMPVRPIAPPVGVSPGAFFLASQEAVPTPIDFTFTEAQLVHYDGEGPGATYDTIRLSSTRATASGAVDVDLYEMYWADLSRVGSSAWRILGELYQVLLHVGSLGKHAASASVGLHPGKAARTFRWTTAGASWALAGPIAILNVYFVVAAALVLTSLVPQGAHAAIAIGIVAVAVLGGAAVALLRSSRTLVPYRIGGLVVAVLVAAGAALSGLPAGWVSGGAPGLLGLEVLLLALGAVGLVLRAYNRHRPGSYWVSLPGGLIVLLAGVAAIVVAGGSEADPSRFTQFVVPGFRIAEALYVVLFASWAVFLALFAVSLVAGGLYRRGISDARRQEAAARAVWTARITLVIPAAMFLLLTIALWSGLNLSLEGQFDGPYRVTPPLAALLGEVATGGEFVRAVLVAGLGPAFVPAAILMTLGTLFTIVSLAPILWTEVAPPRTNRLSAHFGAWLTSAFAVLKGSGRLAVAAFVVWPALMLARGFVALPENFEATAALIVNGLGLAVAVPAAGLLAFRGSLSKLMGGFRAPIDVLLDVDGYLREHPRDAAPRARVFARYHSVLRHLADAQPAYDRIVVIAHSQGTVITADLFRYLNFRNLWRLGDRVTLFTMGSPLRQLYARRFPELYHWVWHANTGAATLETPDIAAATAPDPADLGVRRWVNAYRSGDYIGRSLWRADECGYRFDAPETRAPWSSIDAPLPGHSHDPGYTRREFCIGAGGHTHYWDGTAPEIAVELDLMIRDPGFGTRESRLGIRYL
jgi:hypothetical protein